MQSASIPAKNKLNHLLNEPRVYFAAMFKKILLASGLLVFGLWAAGYDLATLKRDIMGAADNSAGTMSGRNTLEDDGWVD